LGFKTWICEIEVYVTVVGFFRVHATSFCGLLNVEEKIGMEFKRFPKQWKEWRVQ